MIEKTDFRTLPKPRERQERHPTARQKMYKRVAKGAREQPVLGSGFNAGTSDCRRGLCTASLLGCMQGNHQKHVAWVSSLQLQML